MTLESMLVAGWWKESPFADRRMEVVPAHPTNYYSGQGLYPMRACQPLALVWHEPQEQADGVESTPAYFAGPNRDASTTYYADNDGDLYQCVPVNRAPIANGLDGKSMPHFGDGGPEFGAYSLNTQTHSVEVEGYTADIHRTMTQEQYAGCVDLAVLTMVLYDLPRNPRRVGLSHAELSVQRSDGIWIATKSGIPQEAVTRVLKLEKDVQDLKALVWNEAVRNNGQDQNIWSQAVRLNALEAKT